MCPALSTLCWWVLFWNLLGKYHDGYKVGSSLYHQVMDVCAISQLTEPIAETINPYRLFFPRWWLETFDWWQQSAGETSS